MDENTSTIIGDGNVVGESVGGNVDNSVCLKPEDDANQSVTDQHIAVESDVKLEHENGPEHGEGSSTVFSNDDCKSNSPNRKTIEIDQNVEIKQEIKRCREDAGWSSDDEEFAGFEDCNGNVKGDKFSRRKKVKEEPLSDIESHGYDDDLPFDIKVENADVKAEKDNPEEAEQHTDANPEVSAPPASRPINEPREIQHSEKVKPNYRKPFEFGWKREVVYRAQHPDDKRAPDRGKAEVYYITPLGKKLRSKNEIQLHLQEGLDLSMFSFSREAIGMDPNQEIIRSAKPTSATRRANFLDLGEPDPSLGFGKRIPKPKMPKGASPPPTSTQKSKVVSTPVSKRSDTESENKSTAKNSKTSKAKGEPCTIQCVLAMGTIPQLQCKKCLCLYHHECVGLERFTGPIPNYICECCLYELANPNLTPLKEPNQPSSSTSQSCADISTPSQPITSSLPLATPTFTQASPRTTIVNEKQIKNNKSTPTQPTGTATPLSIAPPPTRNSRTNSRDSTGGSVIGSMTTWVPPTASLTSSRSQLDNEPTPPQSIAIVAGRKYIMVPKTNLMSVSPSGDIKIGDNNSTAPPYLNDFAMQQTKVNTTGAAAPLTTGEDVSPPFKKRLLTRSTSKPQTPPAHSPSHSAGSIGTSTTSPKTLTTPISVPVARDKNSTVCTASPSVHKLFATNFFNNVSLGYGVLLHTFQYLKVQELLRASCVCRMWNQAANHHCLWKTVRMKNSQVNDWSGLANTLKSNGTRHLDLRKMLIMPGNSDTTWQHFSENIGKVTQLESIDLCRCSSTVVEQLAESNPRLKVINAISIKDEHLQISGFHRLQELSELRLKSLHTMNIDSLSSLRALKHLKHLSLTSIKDLGNKNIEVLGHLSKLETLELGECSEFSSDFSLDVLSNLSYLERLRLEKGQDNNLFEILDTVAQLPKLVHLELVNFDIKTGFDVHLKCCTNLKRLLLIPTYISQSATTNHMVLKGILDLAEHLEQLTWVVTLELLRVTELYVDQYNYKRKDLKQPEDKIPVLKPIPGMSEEEMKSRNAQKPISDAPQVEIIPLTFVENILATKMPKTNCSILKVPFLATWRQIIQAETQ